MKLHHFIQKKWREFETRKEEILQKHYKKFVIDYHIDGDFIRIISNVGASRKVKNTKENIAKINHTIVKNKIAIAHKIDQYELHNTERVFVLLLNICLLCGCGLLIPFSFFTGIGVFFFLSITSFFVSGLTTGFCGLNYYVLVQEIRALKRLTGYKKEVEFSKSDWKFPFFKKS